ncbi:MAG: MCE family protein [Deltaproteobacteria bacterium]|nr:MCE family protein [Deltaproteobacteria bacterium]
MLKSKTPLLVGLLVIVAAVAFVFTFGSLDTGMDAADGYRVYARFDDATGLVSNSRIMLSGIEVGRLGKIELDPEQPDMARVELLVRKDIGLHKGLYDERQGLWVDGATATRRQASLIGDYYVALTPGIKGPLLGEGDYIPNVISQTGFGAVLKNLEDASSSVFPKLDAITDDIKAITGGLRKTLGEENAVADLKQIRTDIAKTTENVAALTGELRTFLRTDIYPRGSDIQQILSHIDRTAATLEAATARTAASVDKIAASMETASLDVRRFISDQTASAGTAKDGTVAHAIARLDHNMAILEGTLENVRSITAQVEQGKSTVGRLLTDDKLITDIERVVADVSDYTSTFSRTQIKLGFRTDYFVGRGAFKNTIDVSLHPRPDKYYLLQIVDDPVGRTVSTRRVTTTNDPRVPPVLVEDIQETTSQLKISVEIAKRWDFLTFRYGIIENSGGLGIDATLLDDALNFKFDIFEFGHDTYPRLRLLGEWEFLTHFVLAAGIDDILNAGSRDWFVGLGVRFVDDDIKAILPLAPSP